VISLRARLLPAFAVCGVLVAVAALEACGSTPIRWESRWDAPYSDFDSASRSAFVEARERMEAREWARAHELLAPLARAHPDNIQIGVWNQELELLLLEEGAAEIDPVLAAIAADPEPFAALRRSYAQRAESLPSAPAFVLAARLEDDAIAAERLLTRALEIDPECAWAHYGRSHALLRNKGEEDRWQASRAALDRALELEPGHLAARRLQAWMLVQEGSIDAATSALEAWLEATRGDSRVAADQRVRVSLDLAMTFVLAGRANAARQLLVGLEGTSIGRARRLMILAAAQQALGDELAALDSARRAEGAAETGVLPLVQQALLYQYFIGDLDAADIEWEKVLERARSEPDLSTLLEGFRAQVMLERRASALEAAENGTL